MRRKGMNKVLLGIGIVIIAIIIFYFVLLATA